jgi:opacity protein-like surface antigen
VKIKNSFFSFLTSGLFTCVASVSQIYGQERPPNLSKPGLDEIKVHLMRLYDEVQELKGGATANNQIPNPTSNIPHKKAEHLASRDVSKPTPLSSTLRSKDLSSISTRKNTKESKLSGLYFLPFFGFQSSDGIDYKSFLGDIEVEQGNSLSTGVRVGYNWDYFFSDLQLSYFQNILKGVRSEAFPSVSSLEFSGESSGIGFHASIGGKYYFNDIFGTFAGTGFGWVNQEVSFSLSGVPITEKGTLFSPHFFTGVELRPVEHLVIDFRYRWLRIAEMGSFSAHNFNALELSLGYIL